MEIMDENFEQKEVWVVEDKELIKKFSDTAYIPLISSLRLGPMSVKQITKKYNEFVRNKAIKMGIPKDEFEKKLTRSEKTIYRYIKELSDLGVVANCGQRFVEGKTVTENLYCRTAKVILPNSGENKWWREIEDTTIIQRAARILQIVEGVQEIDLTCFSKRIVDIMNSGDKYVFNALNEKYDEVSSILTEGGLEETKKLLHVLNIASILYSEAKENGLMKCYKNDK